MERERDELMLRRLLSKSDTLLSVKKVLVSYVAILGVLTCFIIVRSYASMQVTRIAGVLGLASVLVGLVHFYRSAPQRTWATMRQKRSRK